MEFYTRLEEHILNEARLSYHPGQAGQSASGMREIVRSA